MLIDEQNHTYSPTTPIALGPRRALPIPIVGSPMRWDGIHQLLPVLTPGGSLVGFGQAHLYVLHRGQRGVLWQSSLQASGEVPMKWSGKRRISELVSG